MLSIIGTPIANADRKYGGYFYYNPPGGYPPDDGVSAVYETINPSMSSGNQFYQFVSAPLSSSFGYWVQVGYGKSSTTYGLLRYYQETYDESGHSGVLWDNSGPYSSTSHHYYCERSGSTWTLGVSGVSFDEDDFDVSPYAPVDYLALSETTDSSLSIDGSDCDEISYKSGNDWNFWDTHVVWDADYDIEEDGDDHWYVEE